MSCETKNAMKDSLKKLIEQKPLNKITIADITSDCGINRMTFYYHFKDIYALVEWCIISDAKITSDGRLIWDTWEDYLANVMDVCYANKDFYLTVLNSMDASISSKYILRFSTKIAKRIVSEQAEGIRLFSAYKQRLEDYYAYAIMGVIYCWALNNMEEDIQYIVKYLSLMVKNTKNTLLVHPYIQPTDEDSEAEEIQ